MANQPKHIVVLGAGFGGLTFCQKFAPANTRVTLVDRQNHHLFQPLLYQVATAGLSAPEIAKPIRSILNDRENVTVLMDTVTGINLKKRQVKLTGKTLDYDFLIIGLGGETSYFGHPEWAEFAPGLKSLDDAQRIRRNLLLAFEKAENETDAEKLKRHMTMIVVGGGPTGVELAGSFAELARHVLRRDFKHIDPARANVILVEAGARILAHLPENLSASAQRQLESLGVEVRTGNMVKDIERGKVHFEKETIEAENIVWAAGVAGVPLTEKLGVELDRARRIKVLPDLSIPGHPEVFAVGDIALVVDEEGQPVPGVSPAAMQMAKHAAHLIEDELRQGARPAEKRRRFRYWDKGTMATIGRSAAVAKVGRFEFSGLPAWLAWLAVHLVFLIGFRNKVAVFLQWVYAYLTYKRGARIILGLAESPGTGNPRRPGPKTRKAPASNRKSATT